MKTLVVVALVGMALAGCAGASATRTSQNTLMIDAAAAPACGSQGAAKVAARSAAIETIKAGYDRYIIGGSQAQNNVSVSQMPGSVQTNGTYYGGVYRGTSTYMPGATVVSGSHDRQLAVIMFKNGEPGAQQALDAREQLGPEWQEQVKKGIMTCLS